VDREVEEATVRAFVRRERVDRYVALLRTRTSRQKLVASLYEFDLDGRYVWPIPESDQTPERVYELLRQRGAPEDCYVMSEDRDLDGRWVALQEALDMTVTVGMGTLISCLPGKLAYYEGEREDARYILVRAP
jgi:hypothetical protein